MGKLRKTDSKTTGKIDSGMTSGASKKRALKKSTQIVENQYKESIKIRCARQHNLKGFDVDIPIGKLTVVTGPSGSGKSSLAFHTLYAEGQRRYVETFSPYMRQFMDRMDKPNVELIENIPPAIAIEQKNNVRTTRSTVGTITEINDYLKLIYPRLAIGRDPSTGEEIRPSTPKSICQWVLKNAVRHDFAGTTVLILFAVSVPESADAQSMSELLEQQGYLRILGKNQEIFRASDVEKLGDFLVKKPKELIVVQDRVTLPKELSSQTKSSTGAKSEQVDSESLPKNPALARLLEGIENALKMGHGRCAIGEVKNSDKCFIIREFRSDWFPLRAPTSALFSFNSPAGACQKCRGFGRVVGIDLMRAIEPTCSISEGCVSVFLTERGDECQQDLLKAAKAKKFPIEKPYNKLSRNEQDWLIYGEPGGKNTDQLWKEGKWYGVKGFFEWMETKAYKMHVRVFLSRYRTYTTCPDCRGQRLQPQSLCFTIAGMTLPELWAMPATDLLAWFEKNKPKNLAALEPTTRLILQEISSRLSYLEEVGLGHLTLDRPTRTLSGGEIERVNLTTCLGASLTNTLFVLDEPTVGLHQRDVQQLIRIMHNLRDRGNTLVVVEHEESVMRAADYILDIGPAAGEQGGQLVFQGTTQELLSKKQKTDLQKQSLTKDFLTKKREIPIPKTRQKPRHWLNFKGISCHNLQELDVEIPLGVLACVSGVSGSGKSTLVHQGLYLNSCQHFGVNRTEDSAAKVLKIKGFEHLKGVELVDQSPLARTPRSTPAVYIGVFEAIRALFAATDEAKSGGLTAGYFSFNSSTGRCQRCMGNGFEKITMQFLSDIFVVCPECEGRRFTKEAQQFLLQGKSISDVLGMTVDEAVTFFEGMPGVRPVQICKMLSVLMDCGLGYLRLGQPMTTLSGGESQRLKLVSHLVEVVDSQKKSAKSIKKAELTHASKNSGKEEKSAGTLFIFDEPTTGLHLSDIEKMLIVFRRLVDAGNSVLIIEHNLEVLKSADFLIDLGPEAGADGGKIVAQGTPEEVAKSAISHTAKFLREALSGSKKPAPDAAYTSFKKSSQAEQHQSLGKISIRGAREHNLKNISLDIPWNEFVVLTGLSGSGKSTLAFDIIFAEGQRRFLDIMSPYARQFAAQMEKPDVDHISGLPPTVAIEQRISRGGGKSTVATVTEIWHFLRLLFAKTGEQFCPDCKVPVQKQSVSSIQTAISEVLKKQGKLTLLAPVIRGRKGYHSEIAQWAAKQGFAELLVDKKLVPAEPFPKLARFKEHDVDIVTARLERGISPEEMHNLVKKTLQIGKGLLRFIDTKNSLHLLNASMSCPDCGKSFEELDPRLFSYNSPHGWCKECRGYGYTQSSIVLDVESAESLLDAEMKFDLAMNRAEETSLVLCKSCQGDRLNLNALAVQVDGKNIAHFAQLSIQDAGIALKALKFNGFQSRISRDILPEIEQRLGFLEQIGLSYLRLDRSSTTLSGGESQRIRLAAQLGSNLRGVLYVLDEPTIGLHPRDNVKLLNTLEDLKNRGNSLLVVEHDEETLRRATTLIDLGPGAGRLGGEIVAQGMPSEMLSSPNSITGQALANPLKHPTRGKRRDLPGMTFAKNGQKKSAKKKTETSLEFSKVIENKLSGWLGLLGCCANNLKNVDVAIPVGRLTVITGISGSGKSSLMRGVLHPAATHALQNPKMVRKTTPAAGSKSRSWRALFGFEQIRSVYEVDQSPIGKTIRSTPATYVGIFDEIRAIFAQLPNSKIRGFSASRFSFNTEGGRCEECKGNGFIKLEMDFMPASLVHCEACNGRRYNPATLEIEYGGKTISDVMAMTIDEAAEFFQAMPRVGRVLNLMAQTGLGYLTLGQPSSTLSGGEAQRIKLVTELAKGRGQEHKFGADKILKRNLYLIEEPTIGLHMQDVRRLIDVLHRLVDAGHTVVVIEHNLELIAEADFLLDIGPEAGDFGGQVVAAGTPEIVANSCQSQTAPFLKPLL